MTKRELRRKFKGLQETNRNIERELFETVAESLSKETLKKFDDMQLPSLIMHRAMELLEDYWRGFSPEYEWLSKYIDEKIDEYSILT